MATGGAVRELSEELTCPVCLDYFKDPVILTECGHHFCRACLTHSWGESGEEVSCPVCKQTARRRDLRPNRQLARLVEIAKKLSPQGGEAQERLCEKHREPLKLFCRTDETLICTVCDKSKEHKSHEVIPAEEAAQEYKGKIFNCLETLRTETGKILGYLANVKDESQEMLEMMESKRKKTVAKFRTLYQLLEKQKDDQLAKIEEVEKEVAGIREEHVASLSKKLSSFQSLIRETEERHQQPVNELLQDVRGTLQRYGKRKTENPKDVLWESVFSGKKKKKFGNPEAFPPFLRLRVLENDDNPFLERAMKQLKGSLAWASSKLRAKVTLDSSSATSRLFISGDRKEMSWESAAQDLAEDPEKRYGFVLGSERFIAGCHFWDVNVLFGDWWAVGVARKPVKDRVTFTPEEGIWAVGRWKGHYKAFIKGIGPPLTLRGRLCCIRVCLNYNEGQVAFFDATTAALLYEFSGVSFSGKALHPFFAVVGNGQLMLHP